MLPLVPAALLPPLHRRPAAPTLPATGMRKGSVQKMRLRARASREALTATVSSIGSSGGMTAGSSSSSSSSSRQGMQGTMACHWWPCS